MHKQMPNTQRTHDAAVAAIGAVEGGGATMCCFRAFFDKPLSDL
jgi:hypothetical protein